MFTVVIVLAMLGQQTSRAPTLPPSMEFMDRTSVVGYAREVVFAPMYGGLTLASRTDDLSYAHSSDTGLMVNLRTGELNYVAAPDLMERMILCPSAAFIRSYRSELAKLGKHSPGLPVGWVHNYDIIVKLPTGEEKWEPFTLIYPNKSQEIMEPVLDADGKPTGKGRSLSNETYKITIAPGPKVNTYEWIRVDWPNSRTHWVFTPHASGVMVLRGIGQNANVDSDIRLGYLTDRTLANVTFPKQDMTLLTLNYQNGLLGGITSHGQIGVLFTYATVGNQPVLWKASDRYRAGETAGDSYVYSFVSNWPYPALSQVAVPDQGKWSKSTVEYGDGRITAIQTAGGVRQLVGPPEG